jgi:hypothetical protein
MLHDTPEQIQQRQAVSARHVVSNQERELREEFDQLDRAACTVHQVADRVRTREEQRQWLVWTAAVALVAGLILGLPLAHRLIRQIPDSWM